MVMLAFLLVLSLLLTACGEDRVTAGTAETSLPVQEEQVYEATATVLESPEHGPQLCIGAIMESYPPQCEGPDLVGWSWDAVSGWQSASGRTWGRYRVVGTWDGERLTVTEPPAPADPAAMPDEPSPDFSTPCPEPPGGWAVVDPSIATHEGQDAAMIYARAQPEFAGLWVDQSINPAADADVIDERAMNDPTQLVLNMRFTDHLERHGPEVRSRWGGALCLVEATHTLDSLMELQARLHDDLDALWSSVNEVRGVVEIGVVVADPQVQASLDERHGPGVVELIGQLQPFPAR